MLQSGTLSPYAYMMEMAYKSMDEIVEQIGPTADIVERIRPIYNFKASE